MLLTSLIGPIASLAGTWLDGKVEATKANAQAHVAEAKSRAVVAEKVATGDIDWNTPPSKRQTAAGKTSLPSLS